MSNKMPAPTYFEDAVEPMNINHKKSKKWRKKQPIIVMGEYSCNCGSFLKYNAVWPSWHADFCLINKRGKKK